MSIMDGPSLENELAFQESGARSEADIYGRPVSLRAVIVRICSTESYGSGSPRPIGRLSDPP